MKIIFSLLSLICVVSSFSQDTITINDLNHLPIPFSEALLNDSITYLSDEKGRLIIPNKDLIDKIEIYNENYSDTILLLKNFPKNVYFNTQKILLDETVIYSKNLNYEVKKMILGKKNGLFKFVSDVQIITSIESEELINIKAVNLFYKKGVENGIMKISFYTDNKGFPGEIIYTQYSQLKKGEIPLDKSFKFKGKIYIGFSWLGTPNILDDNKFLAKFQSMKNGNSVFLKKGKSLIKQENLSSFVRFELLYY